ncbi:MAG: glycosyltransferase family 9 protein, partial [Fusobacteriaceae bacterium]
YSYEKSSSALKKLTGEIRGEGYDLLLDFSEMLRVNDMKFINLCRAGVNMGLDRKGWKLFDVSVESERDFQWDEHITKRYGAYLKKLGIEDYGIGYEVFLDSERERSADEFCEKLKKKHPDREKIAIVNSYGASKYRSLNSKNMESIFRMLDKKEYITVAIYSPDKKDELERFLNAYKGEAVYMAQNISNILDSAVLIKKADLVITPDTSVVHIARAFDRKLVALYRKDRKDEHNLKTWGPEYPLGEVILSQADYREGEEIDINSFSMDELQKYI